jgi:glucose-6-phosphate 1-epimerase
MSSPDVNSLNQRFGIPGQLVFEDRPGGFTVAVVANSHATATIALQGAQVMTWAPRKQAPVIWLSPVAKLAAGKSIRGGVPICWPWFGPHATDPKLPGHGFARTVPWEVVQTQALRDGSTRLTFRIVQSEATKAQWPHASEAECVVTVGTQLAVGLSTRNTGSTPITIGDALHTYFQVSDVRRAAIHGLGSCPYLDKVDNGARKQQTGPVTIGAEVDRIYLDSAADCLIDDPGLRRRIRIAKSGSRSTVVWNPWIEKAAKMGDFGGPSGYLNMLCVESANAAEDVVSLAPGASHTLAVQYSVEALAR